MGPRIKSVYVGTWDALYIDQQNLPDSPNLTDPFDLYDQQDQTYL